MHTQARDSKVNTLLNFQKKIFRSTFLSLNIKHKKNIWIYFVNICNIKLFNNILHARIFVTWRRTTTQRRPNLVKGTVGKTLLAQHWANKDKMIVGT